jgi:hypothetical protein
MMTDEMTADVDLVMEADLLGVLMIEGAVEVEAIETETGGDIR